ncbi:MAG: glutamyl-tRNA reductase [Pseudomonadales bacterium]
MRLLAIGVNHSTANVELRERLAFAPDAMQAALSSLLAHLSISDDMSDDSPSESAAEAVIVSTCNRTELIVSTQYNAEAVIAWLAAFKSLPVEQFSEHIYIHEDQEALRHLIRVAGGLDSMILGEPQIFGQMKSSYAVSRQVNAIGVELEPAFQHIFAIAKKVRSDTAIGENPVSVAFAAVTLAQRIFADLSSVAVLLVGAGDTIELVAQHLMNCGAKSVVVANRTLDRAQVLAERLSAKAILLSEVPESLSDFDIVISSTASQLPILGKGAVESALKSRKRRPIFMVDIAVPRDIEPQVADLPDVYLYTVDDLRDIIDHNVRLRVAEADKAAAIIDTGVQTYARWQRSRNAIDLVVSYRNNIQALRDDELERALQLFQAGKSAEEAMTSLARALTQKIMHQPTVEMRNAAGLNNKALLESAKILFGLEGVPSNVDDNDTNEDDSQNL